MSNAAICPACGKENQPDLALCVHCGAPLSALLPAPTTEQVPSLTGSPMPPEHIVQLTRMHQDLVVLDVLGSRQPLLVKGRDQIVVGRYSGTDEEPVVDLTPFNGARLGVSRQHITLLRTVAGYRIKDLNSTNGTWVNEVKVPAGQQFDLKSGDLIRLGQLAFYIHYRTPDPETQSDDLISLANVLDENNAGRLTPQELERIVSPYLTAIVGIQTICDEILDRPPAEVTIKSIKADTTRSSLEIRITGAREAIDLLKISVWRWREIHGLKIAHLWSKNSEDPWRDFDRVAEVQVLGKTGQLKRELHEAEFELAIDLLKDFPLQGTDTERDVYANRLLTHLHVLTLSPLQMVFGEE